ncbi:MAG: hypothetical protein Tsb0034_00560 [Ekhidna sp.]
MALKTFVKISNISNLSDARYCAGMMVDVLGFNVDGTTDNYVSEGDFAEITEWVTGVQFAGEFHNASLEEIKKAVQLYPIDLIELKELDLVEKVQLLGKPIIFRMTISNQDEVATIKSTLSYLDELAKYVVVKCDLPDLHAQIDEQIAFYNGNLKVLKGYGISPTPDLGNYPGIELEATEEERPGFKDYGQIMDVLEAIEED